MAEGSASAGFWGAAMSALPPPPDAGDDDRGTTAATDDDDDVVVVAGLEGGETGRQTTGSKQADEI